MDDKRESISPEREISKKSKRTVNIEEKDLQQKEKSTSERKNTEAVSRKSKPEEENVQKSVSISKRSKREVEKESSKKITKNESKESSKEASKHRKSRKDDTLQVDQDSVEKKSRKSKSRKHIEENDDLEMKSVEKKQKKSRSSRDNTLKVDDEEKKSKKHRSKRDVEIKDDEEKKSIEKKSKRSKRDVEQKDDEDRKSVEKKSKRSRSKRDVEQKDDEKNESVEKKSKRHRSSRDNTLKVEQDSAEKKSKRSKRDVEQKDDSEMKSVEKKSKRSKRDIEQKDDEKNKLLEKKSSKHRSSRDNTLKVEQDSVEKKSRKSRSKRDVEPKDDSEMKSVEKKQKKSRSSRDNTLKVDDEEKKSKKHRSKRDVETKDDEKKSKRSKRDVEQKDDEDRKSVEKKSKKHRSKRDIEQKDEEQKKSVEKGSEKLRSNRDNTLKVEQDSAEKKSRKSRSIKIIEEKDDEKKDEERKSKKSRSKRGIEQKDDEEKKSRKSRSKEIKQEDVADKKSVEKIPKITKLRRGESEDKEQEKNSAKTPKNIMTARTEESPPNIREKSTPDRKSQKTKSNLSISPRQDLNKNLSEKRSQVSKNAETSRERKSSQGKSASKVTYSKPDTAKIYSLDLQKIPYEIVFKLLTTNPLETFCDNKHFLYTIKRIKPDASDENIQELFTQIDLNGDKKLDVNEVGQFILDHYNVHKDTVFEEFNEIWRKYFRWQNVTKNYFAKALYEDLLIDNHSLELIMNDINQEKFDKISFFQFVRSSATKGGLRLTELSSNKLSTGYKFESPFKRNYDPETDSAISRILNEDLPATEGFYPFKKNVDMEWLNNDVSTTLQKRSETEKLLREIKSQIVGNLDYQDYSIGMKHIENLNNNNFESRIRDSRFFDSQYVSRNNTIKFGYLNILEEELNFIEYWPFDTKPDNLMVLEPIRVLKKHQNIGKVHCDQILVSINEDFLKESKLMNNDSTENLNVWTLNNLMYFKNFLGLINSFSYIDDTLQNISDKTKELFDHFDLLKHGFLDRTDAVIFFILMANGTKYEKLNTIVKFISYDEESVSYENLKVIFMSMIKFKLILSYTATPLVFLRGDFVEKETLKMYREQKKQKMEYELERLENIGTITTNDIYDLLDKSIDQLLGLDEQEIWLENSNPEITRDILA